MSLQGCLHNHTEKNYKFFMRMWKSNQGHLHFYSNTDSESGSEFFPGSRGSIVE